MGAAIWGNCNWHGGNVNVHVSHYNSFNRTNINNPNWNHNVDHRKGVPYKDKGVAQKYNRGANDKAAQSREDFRGRAETGRAEMKDMDRSELQNRAAQADRARCRIGPRRPIVTGHRSAGRGRTTGAAAATGRVQADFPVPAAARRRARPVRAGVPAAVAVVAVVEAAAVAANTVFLCKHAFSRTFCLRCPVRKS